MSCTFRGLETPNLLAVTQRIGRFSTSHSLAKTRAVQMSAPEEAFGPTDASTNYNKVYA